MSLAEWGLVIAVVSLLVGIGALGYARRAARVSEEELKLAREQATLRPKLAVSLKGRQYQTRPRNAGWPHDKLVLVFEVANNGRSAANNIRSEIHLDKRHFVRDESNPSYPDLSIPHLGPSDSKAQQISVDVLSYGPTKAHYVCTFDEVGTSEGAIEFEVHERE